jgi:hypothetical protein
MLDYSLALDLAHAAVRDRLREAARRAVVHLLPVFRAARSHPRVPAGRGWPFVSEVNLVELELIVALVVAFEDCVARWGYDSRDGFRLIRH